MEGVPISAAQSPCRRIQTFLAQSAKYLKLGSHAGVSVRQAIKRSGAGRRQYTKAESA